MNQNDEFLKLYGEVMFQVYLIEDMLILHLLFCAQFHVNGYTKSNLKIRDFRLSEAIKAFESVYGESHNIKKLTTPLNFINRIRVKLTHHFVTQVGSDLRTEAGRDQINGMLTEVSKMARVYLRVLQDHHKEAYKLALKKDFMGAFRDEYDPEGPKSVSLSEIQKEIEDFKISLSQNK